MRFVLLPDQHKQMAKTAITLNLAAVGTVIYIPTDVRDMRREYYGHVEERRPKNRSEITSEKLKISVFPPIALKVVTCYYGVKCNEL